ncbi:holo-ACP synthase [Paenibacillus abyssi]|uniref:Holo-[acyl-carrier-protein] synthase n=1 Tax=Paenibacillus abyssi TaxID=1340531 RepID=A0A917G6G5_9BACL|nr:holo-ACP synthase [Paenibacillus abyssi]GGG24263.1 holo-[acyl-carrier-protein] synthase [Paenibacillus abyssi]
MILGIGHDLVEIERISRIVKGASGRRFMERILTEAELIIADQRETRLAEFVAGRFAVKEAIVKALGCGIGAVIGFRDMEVVPGETGQPLCKLTTEAWQRLSLHKDEVRIHVTITHERTMASAFVVIEREMIG